MNVYVTGAAGFIGSHLVRRLLDRGDAVVGIDNFLTGTINNLAGCAGPAFTFVEHDASVPWERFRDRLPVPMRVPDLILHFASPASPVYYGAYPLETLATNSLGTIHAVQCAVENGARVLFASTSETYGDPLEHPQRETYWGNVNPVGIRACYDEGKRFGEAYVTSAVRAQHVDGRIVRIFNTYGPRMQPDDGRVVPNFLLSALRGEPLTIYGDGTQTRSFCYVDDLVDGILRCADAPDEAGIVVNLGNPVEHTMHELADVISSIAGVPLRIDPRPLPSDDPKRRKPDISLARAKFGWEPRVAIRDGLQRTFAYFSDQARQSVA